MSGKIQKAWSQSLQSLHCNDNNKRSPFVNKCLLRAKESRQRNIRKLREGLEAGYGYAALATEIIKEIRGDAALSMEEDSNFEEEFLFEVTEAIRLEYEVSEYLNYEEENESECIQWYQSQMEMSEVPEYLLLVCPFCRKSAMTFSERGDGMECSCSKSIYITSVTASTIPQLRDMLGGIFDRWMLLLHRFYCTAVTTIIS